MAQSWADKLVAENKFGHSNSKFGENIYSSWSSDPSAASKISGSKPVDSWYSEIEKYT